MRQFAPLLLILLFWIFLGPLSKRTRKDHSGKTGGPFNREKTRGTDAGNERKADGASRENAEAQRIPVPAEGMPAQPIAPTVAVTGSLPMSEAMMPDWEHTEGEDPLHPEHERSLREEAAAEEMTGPTGLRLSWEPDDVVKGWIYGEILNRRKAG